MPKEAKRSRLLPLFDNVDPSERAVVERLISEVEFLETRMDELRKLPWISTHPTNKNLQKSTAAWKQYKECSQSYMNGVRILLSVLRNVDGEAKDELLSSLAEFEFAGL